MGKHLSILIDRFTHTHTTIHRQQQAQAQTNVHSLGTPNPLGANSDMRRINWFNILFIGLPATSISHSTNNNVYPNHNQERKWILVIWNKQGNNMQNIWAEIHPVYIETYVFDALWLPNSRKYFPDIFPPKRLLITPASTINFPSPQHPPLDA